MSRLRERAEQAVNNVWLLLAQRFAVLIGVPIFLAAGASFMTLRDQAVTDRAELAAAKQRITSLEAIAGGLRTDQITLSTHVTRLQAQRENDAAISQRINELREDIQRVSMRLDQMLTPPRRIVP